MEQQIISNKVYESLQVPTENIRTTTGKVLYANRFSGVAQVAMPNDLKRLIDSDFGLIGKNILIQLEQKMRGYTHGPWYVDSRDGVIYIHNRKFKEEPVATYTYQGENGEVLSVSFATQKVTKRVKVTLSPTIDDENKDLITITGDISEPKDDHLNRDQLTQYNDNTQYVNYGSDFVEDNRSHPSVNHVEDWKSKYISWGQVDDYLKHKQELREVKAMTPSQVYEHGTNEYLNDFSVDELRGTINKVIKDPQFPADIRAEVEAVFKNLKNSKNLEADLRKALKGAKYVFSGEDQMRYLTPDRVDPRDYDPQKAKKGGATAWGIEDEASVNRGIAALRKDPYIEVVDDTPKVRYKNPLNKSLGIYDITVEVIHRKKTNLTVPIYKLYHNLFSRYGGADKFLWAAKANANGGLKKEETTLVCRMQVIGRPLLASSQTIYIDNVGKRWSGLWYIKRCTHTMDPGQGYITNLELIQNSNKSGTAVAKGALSTQDIVANDARADAKTDNGKDKKSNSNNHQLDLKFTSTEVMYAIEEGIIKKDGTVGDVKKFDTFARKKAYYTEVLANTPQEKAEGIVATTSFTMDSEGKVAPPKYNIKTIQVPEDYWVKFDYLEIIRKQFERNRKSRIRRRGLIWDMKLQK